LGLLLAKVQLVHLSAPAPTLALIVDNMESLSEHPWDVIIAGTGLDQSLLAL
jgi:hypothetical protein